MMEINIQSIRELIEDTMSNLEAIPGMEEFQYDSKCQNTFYAAFKISLYIVMRIIGMESKISFPDNLLYDGEITEFSNSQHNEFSAYMQDCYLYALKQFGWDAEVIDFPGCLSNINDQIHERHEEISYINDTEMILEIVEIEIKDYVEDSFVFIDTLSECISRIVKDMEYSDGAFFVLYRSNKKIGKILSYASEVDSRLAKTEVFQTLLQLIKNPIFCSYDFSYDSGYSTEIYADYQLFFDTEYNEMDMLLYSPTIFLDLLEIDQCVNMICNEWNI